MMLSIIVPIYNVEKYLNQCIDSILAQTYKDFELILVDDGSTDRCPEICDEYAKKDARIKVIHKENGGPQSAIIAGIEYSRGDLIGFVDGDDWIDSNMYATLMQYIDNYALDCVICGCRDFYEGGGEVYTKAGIPEGLYDENNIMYLRNHLLPNQDGRSYISFVRWNRVLRREYLLKNLININVRIYEDAMTTVPAMLECTKVYITDKPLYNYRRGNEASLIGRNYSKDNFEDIWKVIDAFSSLKKGFSEKELLSAAFCMIRSIIKRVLNSNCSFKEQRSYIKQIVKDARVVKLVSRIDKERMTKIYRVWYTLIRYKLVSAIIIGDKLRSR